MYAPKPASEDSESSSEETSSESGLYGVLPHRHEICSFLFSGADSGANSRPPKSNKVSKAKAVSFPQQNPSPKKPKVSAESKVKPPASKSSSSSSESSSSSDSESDEPVNDEVKKVTPGSKPKGPQSGGATVAISPKSEFGGEYSLRSSIPAHDNAHRFVRPL